MQSLSIFGLRSTHALTGIWKSQVESPYSDPSRGHEFYPSPKLSAVTKANTLNYGENNSLPPVSNKSMFWSNQAATVTESAAPVAEKRQANGYRLFGIELVDHSTVEETSPAILSGAVTEDQVVISRDSESDQQSEPSRPNRSDIPSVSCEPEKSCLRSPHESHGRQIRSCTKVF